MWTGNLNRQIEGQLLKVCHRAPIKKKSGILEKQTQFVKTIWTTFLSCTIILIIAAHKIAVNRIEVFRG